MTRQRFRHYAIFSVSLSWPLITPFHYAEYLALIIELADCNTFITILPLITLPDYAITPLPEPLRQPLLPQLFISMIDRH
jgi:hypothetical protein